MLDVYCLYCGTKLTKHDLFCTECGKTVIRPKPPITSDEEETVIKPEITAESQQKPEKRRSWQSFVLGVVLSSLILFLATIALLWNAGIINFNSPTKSENPSVITQQRQEEVSTLPVSKSTPVSNPTVEPLSKQSPQLSPASDKSTIKIIARYLEQGANACVPAVNVSVTARVLVGKTLQTSDTIFTESKVTNSKGFITFDVPYARDALISLDYQPTQGQRQNNMTRLVYGEKRFSFGVFSYTYGTYLGKDANNLDCPCPSC